MFSDKSYSGQQYRHELETARYFYGIMYKATRNRLPSEPQCLLYRAISQLCVIVEAAFVTLKRDHRMARARYLVVAKEELQPLLDAMAANLKKAVRMVGA